MMPPGALGWRLGHGRLRHVRAVSVILFAAILHPADATADARHARLRAIEALKQSRAAEAVAILEAAVEEDPGAVDLLELLGQARQVAGDAGGAVEIWERTLRAFPERHSARLWLAQLLESRGKVEEARGHFELLVTGRQEPPAEVSRPARLGFARTLLAGGKYAEARRAIEPLLGAAGAGPAGDEGRAEAALLEVRALREEGRLDAAIEAARARLSLLPEGNVRLASLLRDRAVQARLEKDLDTAVEALRESVSLDPAPAAAHLLGAVLLESMRPEEALAVARAALERDGSARFAEVMRVQALAALGREEEVLADLGEVARRHGGDPEAAVPLLLALEPLERLPQALETWSDADPETPEEARPILGRLLAKASARCRRSGEAARARRLCDRALAVSPGTAAVQNELGWVELEAGRPEEALRAWEPLLALDSAGAEVHAGVARAERALGRLPEAIEHARLALRSNPEDRSSRLLHWSLLEEARQDGELLAALDPDRLPSVQEGDGAGAAVIFRRRLREAPFLELLERWSARLPADPALRQLRARVVLGEARLARSSGDLTRAASLYRSSLELDPGLAAALRGLARVIAASGDSRGALEALQAADRLEPDSPGGKAALVRALREEDRLKEARRALESASSALRREPLLALEEARLEYAERRFAEAASRARGLAAMTKDAGMAREAWLLGADALAAAGRSAEAAEALEHAVLLAPGDGSLLARLLRTASQAGPASPGAVKRAVGFLEDLAARFPEHPEPFLVLGAHFLARRDFDRARGLLERYLASRSGDASAWSLLGEAQLGQGDHLAVREAFRTALALSPGDTRALSGLANAEMLLGRPEEALAVHGRALSRNPYQRAARISRAKVLESMGDRRSALVELETAEQALPDDLDLALLRARVLLAAGRRGEALEELEWILDLAAGGALPVLLYPRLSTRFDRDCMPLPLFRSQMQALNAAGYRAVGLQDVERWIRGDRRLPERAVLITFDDGSLDNLVLADPILEELGFRAVQFVPTALLGGDRGCGGTCEGLKRFASLGRWELGSQGHLAHGRIAVNASGTEGLFLVSRRWIGEEGRLETREEMAKRIEEDLRLSKRELASKLGLKEAASFAFPHGSLGQRDLTNEPQAYPLNLRLLRKHFRLGFHESENAYNLRSRRLPLLDRFPVPEDWDGEKLLAYLRRTDPAARARLEKGRFLANTGRISSGLEELEKAAALGADEREVRFIRGSALLWRGDRLAAAAEFRRLLEVDPGDPRAHEGLEKIEQLERPAASARLDLWWDSDDRLVFRQSARGEVSPLPWLRLHAEAGHATYRETGAADVDIDSITGEAGALAYLPGPLELEGAAGGSWFDGARDAPHYSAALRYRGLDRAVLEAGAAGGPVETPLGVAEGIRQDAQSAAGFLRITPEDQLSLSYRHAFYSDANDRDTVRWEYGHRFLEKPELRLGYAGTYDDTRKDAVEYYAPEALHLHRATARVGYEPWERLSLESRFSLGYGWEDGRGRLVGDASGEATWRLTESIELSAWISYFRNPRYWAATTGLNLVIRF